MSEQQILTGSDPSINSGNRLADSKDQLVSYLKELKEEGQEDGTALPADVIVDRMIGAIVAQGVIESSDETDNYPFLPVDIVSDLLAEAMFAGQNYTEADWLRTLSRFTRQKGVRAVAKELLKDSSTADALAKSSNLLQDRDRQVIALNSEQMLRGYLTYKLERATDSDDKDVDNATGWEEEIVQQVVNFADNATDPRERDWKSRVEMSQSENDNLREEGTRFMLVLERARKAGVDIDLVNKTAEVLWRQKRRDEKVTTKIGVLAVSK